MYTSSTKGGKATPDLYRKSRSMLLVSETRGMFVDSPSLSVPVAQCRSAVATGLSTVQFPARAYNTRCASSSL
jgi:hypothetical protein